ncbi:MAG: diguanylate cyclase [Syntrophus sp. (in: bacteria)]
MNKRLFIYSLLVILLMIVAATGWFATDYLGNNARQEIIGENRASALTLSVYVSSTLNYIEGAVKSLAGSPWIAPTLLSKGVQDIEHANSALDRYNSALNASVSYLMDADGMTVASSNRDDPDSFVGKSYRFRPYFQKAAKGKPDRYFALGITSGKRGFYASYPVQNRLGKVVGVVTMKKDLDEMEAFFNKYPFCFLISPEGIIFLSSKPAMVLKSLWPMDKTVQEKLIASQQFGNKLSKDAFFKKEIADGMEVALEENNYFVSRKVLDNGGWSIVLLTPTDRVRIYKLIGILATIGVCSLIMFFSGIIYVTDRSKASIRESEESKRLLLNAAGDGIFGVDITGRVTFVNSATLCMLGFSEEEMLGQSAHALIHHSRNDGSNYPLEDCPMYASYTKTTENTVTDEVLWRKVGSSFPVEYSSTPIVKDGKTMGAVVTFRNITERKHVELQIRERMKELQAFYTFSELVNRKGITLEELFQEFSDTLAKSWQYPEITCAKIVIGDKEFRTGNFSESPWMQSAPIKVHGSVEGQIEVCYLEKRPEDYEGPFMKEERLLIDALAERLGHIAERKQAEEKIQQMAYHDSLTGLPNRKLFSDRLGITLAQAQRNKKIVGIAMIDLDHFKDVNDTLGHDVGDLLLKATSERLSAALRKGDTVARFGGDEFVLILPDMEVIEDAIQVAQKIVDSFCEPFPIDTHQLVVTTSIGIAVYPDDGIDEGILLKNADIAMYQAKQAGRARYQIYKGA